jgi:hypothetical protein
MGLFVAFSSTWKHTYPGYPASSKDISVRLPTNAHSRISEAADPTAKANRKFMIYKYFTLQFTLFYTAFSGGGAGPFTFVPDSF